MGVSFVCTLRACFALFTALCTRLLCVGPTCTLVFDSLCDRALWAGEKHPRESSLLTWPFLGLLALPSCPLAMRSGISASNQQPSLRGCAPPAPKRRHHAALTCRAMRGQACPRRHFTLVMPDGRRMGSSLLVVCPSRPRSPGSLGLPLCPLSLGDCDI